MLSTVQKHQIRQTAEMIRKKFASEASGHDWWHIYRVWRTATYLGNKEKADVFIVQMAALLHDIADWKFHHDDENIGPQMAAAWLAKIGVSENDIQKICSVIKHLSFKGMGVKNKIRTLEGKVVQDADRLDAIGAIGIARTFAYGGFKGREMYNPSIRPVKHRTFSQYKKSRAPTINHFYEKLLHLKQLMNTQTARRIAKRRHQIMENFLKEFYKEWNHNPSFGKSRLKRAHL